MDANRSPEDSQNREEIRGFALLSGRGQCFLDGLFGQDMVPSWPYAEAKGNGKTGWGCGAFCYQRKGSPAFQVAREANLLRGSNRLSWADVGPSPKKTCGGGHGSSTTAHVPTDDGLH